ncbi:phosphotransferase enzyme family protein [Rubrolithibacter danxiaensis]|uniref:phosphotransferase enzyme family protein n=1 Tax=Rubrolithibacter danxiaensis TaxID=3390805 RepID=UPI003BF80605
MQAETINTLNLQEIISNFSIEGGVSAVKPYGSGHINDTFHIANSEGRLNDYLLQRINDKIFKNVPALMENIRQVTLHLKNKLAEDPASDPDREVLTLIPAKDNKFYYKDSDSNYWRMYIYIPHTKSYDILETENQAFEGGKAFGKFQSLLSDMDISLLQETIPDFHNIEKRLQKFRDIVAADPEGRVSEVISEIQYILERADKMCAIPRLVREGKLIKRITHNDTKFNNVLLNEHDKAQCVIDLDTVMPGYVSSDFGDAIRTIINTGSEDEKDLDKIDLNIPLFKAYTKGYLEEACSFLSPAEIESLSLGVLLLPYMQVIRFLTDYLEGDVYYKISFPGHNLQRTKAQLKLFQKLEEQYDFLKKIIEETVETVR